MSAKFGKRNTFRPELPGTRIDAKGDGPKIALSNEAGVVGVFVHPDRRRREVFGEACADQLCFHRLRLGIGEAELSPKLTEGKLGERAALTLQPSGGIDDGVSARVALLDKWRLRQHFGDFAVALPDRLPGCWP